MPVGEYLEGRAHFRAPCRRELTKVLGRPVREDNWRLSPLPVMMLKGRPEPNSIMRGERPIAEELAREAAAAELARLVDAAEDEAMALVEERGGTIGAREVAVLRSERGLQVGGIVNGVRPGVGREEFVMAAEALAQVGGQAVIDRAAVGVVGVHVAEGDAAGRKWLGLQAALKPAVTVSAGLGHCIRCTQPSGRQRHVGVAIEGFRPPGRKKFVSAA